MTSLSPGFPFVFLANSFSSPLRVALCTLKSWCPQGSVLVPFIAPHIFPVLTFASTTTFLWCLCHHGGLPAARDTFQSTFHPNNQWYLSKMQIKTGHYAVINKHKNATSLIKILPWFHPHPTMVMPNYLQFLKSIKVFCAFVALHRLFYEPRMFLQVSTKPIPTCLPRLCLNVPCVSSPSLTFHSDLHIPLLDYFHTCSPPSRHFTYLFPSVVRIPWGQAPSLSSLCHQHPLNIEPL